MGAKGKPDRSHQPRRIRDANDHWVKDALCATEHADFDPPDTDIYAVAYAKTICRRCPVQGECLAWAIDHHEGNGIWGGLTPAERWALQRRAKCGTESAYRRHYRNGETACQACKDAHRAYEHRHGRRHIKRVTV